MEKPGVNDRAMPESTDAYGSVERELMRFGRLIEAAQRKRSFPLDRAEFLILRTLAERGSFTVGRLARLLFVDDSTMTRQVAGLEAKGFTERRADPADRRSGIVAVTPAGEAAMRETLALRIERVRHYLGSWEPDERAAFAAGLKRLNDAVIRTLEEPG